MKANLSSLEKALKYKFKDINYLIEALTHSSYSYEHKIKCSNERLELLGDSVIHLAITEFLLSTYPDADEGMLSSIRGYCESEAFLSDRATELDLGIYIQFGKGEALTGGQFKESLLSNTYEAVVAAIHQDGGYKQSSKFVVYHFAKHIINAYDEKLYIDSKSELQKFTQKHYGVLPHYRLINEEGADHEKIFHVEVRVELYSGIFRAKGSGRSKKNAEKEAAAILLSDLTDNTSN